MLATASPDAWKNPPTHIQAETDVILETAGNTGGGSVVFYDLTNQCLIVQSLIVRNRLDSGVQLAKHGSALSPGAIHHAPLATFSEVRQELLSIPSPSLEEPDTIAFLMRHPSVAPLLAPARGALLRAFPGSHVTTRVDDTFDPDYGRPRDQLVITVWIHADSTDSLDRIDRFYDDWVPNHLDDGDRLLRFDLGVA